MRKSAARSITLTPASSSARVCCIATPLGVAKNTTSQFSSPASSGVENASFTRPRRLGNMSATGIPASLRDVMAFNSACGWRVSSRSNSTPV